MEAQPTIHALKCLNPYFGMVQHGIKHFEVRKNDRGFTQGDILLLKEYVPSLTQEDEGYYTGNFVKRKVVYIIEGGQFGIEEGYCIMILSPKNHI